MTEKRFTICVDSNNLKSLWDDERTEEEPLLWLTLSDRIGGIDDVCKLLNELHDENQKLKEEIIEWKSKYFDAMDTVINEYSTNIKKDMEELEKEVWGDVE